MSVAKKQKVDNPRSPIIFQSPGLKADVRLVVLDQEFHVHSVLLKLHWAFFRKFLDSPDKISTISGSASGIHYEWLTKVDDDGTWHLIAKGALKVSIHLLSQSLPHIRIFKLPLNIHHSLPSMLPPTELEPLLMFSDSKVPTSQSSKAKPKQRSKHSRSCSVQPTTDLMKSRQKNCLR
jgi:hypothetical protein